MTNKNLLEKISEVREKNDQKYAQLSENIMRGYAGRLGSSIQKPVMEKTKSEKPAARQLKIAK